MTTSTKASDLARFARSLTESAPDDYESWLCLGWALEAEVWTQFALEEFPRWPWTVRHPLVRQHQAYLRGEDVALVAPQLQFHEMPDVREVFDEVRFKGEVEKLPDGSHVLHMGWETTKTKGIRIPEYVLHQAWLLRLQKGRVANDVREDPEFSSLSESELGLLRAAAEAYAQGAILPMEESAANFVVEALYRIACAESLHVPFGVADTPMTHIPSEEPRHDLGAEDVLAGIDANPTVSGRTKARARLLYESERELPGFSLEMIVDTFGMASGNENRDLSRLIEAAELALEEEIVLMAAEVPTAQVFQVSLANGRLSPPLLPLTPELRHILHSRSAGGNEILRLLLFLAQVDRANSIDWAMIHERWSNACDGKPPFVWGGSLGDHMVSDLGKGKTEPAKLPIGWGLMQAIINAKVDGQLNIPTPDDVSVLSRRLDILAPWE